MKKQFDQPSIRLVDLEMLTFSAKIDYITIYTPGKVKLPALNGKATWPQKFHGNRLTVHDASPEDINTLIKTFGSARLIELEVAIDVKPRKNVPDAAGDSLLRSVIVDLFARGLEPSAGICMRTEFRAFYRRLESGYIVRPFNKGLPRATDQQLHGGRDDAVQVKVYWKRRDQGVILAPEKQVARVEVRLGALGLDAHDLATLVSLKQFRFRKCLMPYFSHIRGTSRPARSKCEASKPLLTVLRNKQHEIDREHWPQVGVGAFLPGGKRHGEGIRLLRNTKVNNRIGQALTRLQKQLRKTKFVRFDQSCHEKNPMLTGLYDVAHQSCMTN